MPAQQTNHISQDPDIAARQYWMSVLARSSADELQVYLHDLKPDTGWTQLRKPETGLVMTRGRAGGQGQRFNLGEVTVTRCSVQLESGRTGHAWIRGRDSKHAELAAVFDALLQDPSAGDALKGKLIDPIATRLSDARKARADKVAATKVDFYTMVRGED